MFKFISSQQSFKNFLNLKKIKIKKPLDDTRKLIHFKTWERKK